VSPLPAPSAPAAPLLGSFAYANLEANRAAPSAPAEPSRLRRAAERFCEELQENADGVPQDELRELHAALDELDESDTGRAPAEPTWGVCTCGHSEGEHSATRGCLHALATGGECPCFVYVARRAPAETPTIGGNWQCGGWACRCWNLRERQSCIRCGAPRPTPEGK